ncbi:MAG: nucleotidyltransferase [Bacteroidia bacterium]|nr:nucleotidyltransferase [Bacteroidia bacterium]
MSVQTYLERRSREAILRDDEKTSIQTSIQTLKQRLSYSGLQISESFQFGSSTRGTILPRKMDEKSDIDYMIVFSDGGYNPQTYISRLKYFAEKYYSSSEIKQSHPTVVLNLNHISFDLVPAFKRSYDSEYVIPASNKSYMEWMPTSPNAFNAKLTEANKRSNSLLKPTIRLLKYWNACSNHIFSSYELEQMITNRLFYNCYSIRDYFFDSILNLSFDTQTASSKTSKLMAAQNTIRQVLDYERRGELLLAESVIKRIIPEY